MRIPQKQFIDKYSGYLLIILLLPITRLLGILLKRNHLLSKPPQNLLFIKILGLGSLITAVDSINYIRQKYPEAKLILLTENNIAEGIKPFIRFDSIWFIDSGNLFAVIKSTIKLLRHSWTLKDLWVIDLEVYSKLTTIYALITFARNRFGFYLSPVFFRKYLNTHNVFFDQEKYLGYNYNQMAIAISGKQENRFEPNHATVRKDEQLKQYIALNNTCSDLALVRMLPEKIFVKICSWILENTNCKLVLCGAKQNQQEINNFIDQAPEFVSQKNRIINIAGAGDFNAYYKFLQEECICMISIDSAPLHIAKRLGIPTLSIWGPTNPNHYLKIEPYEKERHLVIYQQVACSPCIHRHETLPCHGNNLCMKNLDGGMILSKLETLLRKINKSMNY
ncbi:MAG: glycosyltransferase family 9 protein [Bacteroidota bacterium]|nr:glycosyltransferase family 9 protein [Bacteroidota bacterium]